MESSEQPGACISSPVCTNSLILSKGAIFILFFLVIWKSNGKENI